MTEPITIVHYWAGCPVSPSSKWQRFLQIVQRCHEQGWRNVLVWSSMPENQELVEPFRKAKCEIIIQARSQGNFDVTSIRRVRGLLRALKCDIFHCHNDHTSPLIAAALARVSVRMWSILAMTPYYETGIAAKGLKRFMPSLRVSCLCASRVLAISSAVRQEVVDAVGFSKRIIVVPAPVDTERFASASEGDIRKELGLDSSHLLITAVGHAVVVKGWDVAIKAFAEVQQKIPNARLVLVGSLVKGEEVKTLQYLKELATNLRVLEFVHFVGRRDDIPQILKASNIFVMPSRSEGMGAALIEAMASGLPCVAAEVGGIPEVMTHGETGLLFGREDVRALADCVLQLLEDESLRNRIALQTLSHARSFEMHVYVDRIFDCYQQLLKSHSL